MLEEQESFFLSYHDDLLSKDLQRQNKNIFSTEYCHYDSFFRRSTYVWKFHIARLTLVDYRYRLWLIPHFPMWRPSALHSATFSMIYISVVSQTLCWWWVAILRTSEKWEMCGTRKALLCQSEQSQAGYNIKPPLILQYCLVWSLDIRLLIEQRPVNCYYLYKVLSLSWGRQRTD